MILNNCAFVIEFNPSMVFGIVAVYFWSKYVTCFSPETPAFLFSNMTLEGCDQGLNKSDGLIKIIKIILKKLTF